jgi:hypothetical protein
MTTDSALVQDETCLSSQQLAAFDADLAQVLRTIAERYASNGAGLTWQLVRDIREETLADLGLAARWPVEVLERVATHSGVPPLDGWIVPAEIGGLCDLARNIANVFQRDERASPEVVGVSA